MASSSNQIALNSKVEEISKEVDASLATHIGADIPYGAIATVPLGICALGQVMLTASSVADMSINNPPKDGFKHIEYPNSLRTTLLQISNLGYESLHTGHQGMAMIHGYSKQIKTAAMEAAKLMQQMSTPENKEQIEKIIELRLKNIGQATGKCHSESKKVVAALEKLLALLDETSKACSSSMQASEDQLKKNQEKEKELQEKKKVAEEEKQRKLKEKEEFDVELKKTQEELHAALGAVPKGLALLGLEALDMIRKLFNKKGKSGTTELMKARMEIAKQANLETERKIEKANEEMKTTNREFLDAVVQLSHLDLSNVSYNDALDTLNKAVRFITELLDHWRKLDEFCQSLNNAIQQQLVDECHKLEEDRKLQLTLPDRSLMSNDILNKLKMMSQQSYQIGCIGELYVKMSSAYIMPAIGALSRNSAIEPGRAPQVMEELKDNATRAHESIIGAIEGEKRSLLAKVEAQKLKINQHIMVVAADDNDNFIM